MKLDRVIAVRNDKTVYRDGDACVKVFGDGYSKSDVLNEALNQARIEETGINVPKIREVTTVEGKWAIVSDFIRGKTLRQLMNESVSGVDEYIEMLAELQLEIQSKTCPLLSRMKDKMNMKICQSDLDATLRFDFHSRLEAMPKHSKVCHGDLSPSNVIVGDDGKIYIIDWAHASQGNGSADAVKTYLLFVLSGEKEAAEKYLDLYCGMTGVSGEYVRRWIPIVACSLSVTCKSKDRERLLSLINNV